MSEPEGRLSTHFAYVQGAALCKQEVFRQVEDRPVLKQRTRFVREHHIFEKTYVREVRLATCLYFGDAIVPLKQDAGMLVPQPLGTTLNTLNVTIQLM